MRGAYSLSLVRTAKEAGRLVYDIMVAWELPEANREFCGVCRVVGGVCRHGAESHADLCL
jgi:hypothetical protein